MFASTVPVPPSVHEGVLMTVPTPHPSPSLPTTPVHPTGCTSGADNIPPGWLGRIICGDLLPHAGHASVKQLAAHYAPYAVAAVALLVAARLGWAWAKRSAWRRSAVRAVWLEIVPPISATPVTTVALWQSLAQNLDTPSRFTLRPRRLVWEVHATRNGMRCGIWTPPGINPTAVIGQVQRAWPGARIAAGAHPLLPQARPTVGLRLVPLRPEWLPLVADEILAPVLTRTVWRSIVDEQGDRMRGVFGALGTAGRGGDTVLQIVVGKAPYRRWKLAKVASSDPAAARRARHSGGARVVGLALDGLLAAVRLTLDAVVSLLSTGSSSRASTPRGGSRPEGRLQDPVMRKEAHDAHTKFAAGARLLVGVRVVTTGETRKAARATAEGVVGGFAYLGGHLGRVRQRRTRSVAAWRTATEAELMLATVAEVAALAGLPTEPAAYGLPAAASRRRGPGPDNWRPTGGNRPDGPDEPGEPTGVTAWTDKL
jgi:hypothetical protein